MALAENTDSFPVFYHWRDIRIMQELRSAYLRAFSNDTGIDKQHKQVPDSLDLRINKEESLLFFISGRTVGSLPKRLLPSQLKPDYFSDIIQSYSRSINYSLTMDVISIGTGYIDAIEQDIFQRMSWHAFDDINRPDYYLIFAISTRVTDLCKIATTCELVTEYDCLGNFVKAVITLAQDYFKSDKSVEPFHCYLNSTTQLLKKMSDNVIFYLERSSIANALEDIACSLESYQSDLAIYLAYCLSNASLNKMVSIYQLKEDARLLPSEFKNSVFYQQLHDILQGHEIVAKLRIDYYGVSNLVINLHRQNPNVVLKALASYRDLLTSLSALMALVSTVRLLSDSAKLRGEYKIVHDKVLHFMLNTIMTLTRNLIYQCQERMKVINDQNELALKYHENIKRGASANIKQAQQKTDHLIMTAKNIAEQQSYINERILKIEALTIKSLDIQHHELVEKTAQLLTSCEKSATIPSDQAKSLLYGLRQQCSPTLCKVDLSSAKRECLPVGLVTQGEVAMFPSSRNDLPKANEERLVPVTRFPFSDVYNLLDSGTDTQGLIAEFHTLMNALYSEIDVTLSQFVARLEATNQQRLIIDDQCTILAQKQSAQSNDFDALDQALGDLQSSVQSLQYGETHFVSFSLLNHFITHVYNPREDLLIANIRTFLLSVIQQVYPNENGEQHTNHMDDLVAPILTAAIDKAAPLMERLNQLKQSVAANKELYKADLVHHYQSEAASLRSRLLSQETDRLLSTIDPEREQMVPELPQSLPPSAPVAASVGSLSSLMTLAANELWQREQKQEDVEDQQTSLQRLRAICHSLFDEAVNKDVSSLGQGLKDFYEYFCHASYELRYWGGDWVNLTSGRKKVSYHAKLVIDDYQNSIAGATTIQQLQALRDRLLRTLSQAADNVPQYFCLFYPRTSSTQERYDVVKECTRAYIDSNNSFEYKNG